MGKVLMALGTVLLIVGAILYFGEKFINLGRLPGDIHIERGNYSVHFPIVTSILVSIILTVVLNLLFGRR